MNLRWATSSVAVLFTFGVYLYGVGLLLRRYEVQPIHDGHHHGHPAL